MDHKTKKWVSKEAALAKLQRYCAYQDRCHQEVRNKLLDLGIYGEDLEDIIAELITEGFLNEERFARSFVRGKYRMKQWGRTRIRQELKVRKISDYCIRKGLEEVDEQEYLEILQRLLEKKAEQLTGGTSFEKNTKLYQFALRRGFESELIATTLKELLQDS
ncbi:MAG: RecX family transcriptional regulator [Phaeodactylibacter sp.]|nr:RecX family transcriptional regulator [Phaeodactylibacter sp.]